MHPYTFPLYYNPHKRLFTPPVREGLIHNWRFMVNNHLPLRLTFFF